MRQPLSIYKIACQKRLFDSQFFEFRHKKPVLRKEIFDPNSFENSIKIFQVVSRKEKDEQDEKNPGEMQQLKHNDDWTKSLNFYRS